MPFCSSSETTAKTCETRKPWRKALLIGIAYTEDDATPNDSHPVNLRGPHKDCRKLGQFLQDHYGYKKEDTVMLLDTKKNMKKKKFSEKFPDRRPTRDNIIREISNLVKGAKPGDHFFFHYSGHGDQVPCRPGDLSEPDGMDETLVPCDAKLVGGNYVPETLILDNLMHDLMVKPLPMGARLTAVYDMCHAGTALDLEHYDCNRVLPPFWWKSLKANFETQGFGQLTRTQSTCIPDLAEPGANEDTPPAPSQVRVIPSRQPRRRSHLSEHTIRLQPVGRNIQQEVSKTTYVEGHAAQDKPGMQRLEIRTRSMSLNPEDPAEPTEISTKTTKTRPSSPTYRQPLECKNCSLPLNPITERSDSFAMSITSTMQQAGVADELPLIPARPTSSPVDSARGKRVLICFPVGWPPKLFRRKAKTTDSSSHAGNDVNRSAAPAKAASEGSVQNLAPNLQTTNKHMSPIQEDVVESPTSYSDQRMSSPVQLTCTCKGVMNDAGYPDVSRGIFPRQISIASCSDEQSTFEGPKGLSVTQTLIGILKKDPHPTYKILMKEMSRSLYDQAQEMLRFYRNRRRYREGMKSPRRKSSVLSDLDADFIAAIIDSAKNKDEDEWEDFVVQHKPVQDPQLGSQKRLNLNDRFSP